MACQLWVNPLSYVVELVKKAEDEADMEYMRSMVDAWLHAATTTSRHATADVHGRSVGHNEGQ
jgi:hypothetical protein